MNPLPILVGTPEELTRDGIAWLHRDGAESAFYYVSAKRDEELWNRTRTVDAALSYVESRRESYAWRFAGPQFRGQTIAGRLRKLWAKFCGEAPPLERHHRPSLFSQPQPERMPPEESCIIE